jgi:16S rRNA (uracil1498-N3)-methyltransferase
MKTHHFIINQNLIQGKMVIIDTEFIHQLKDVLKLKTGETIIVGDGQGNLGTGKIVLLDKKAIEIEIEKLEKREKGREVNLYCAILKKDNFEWVAQKATEVGVTRIIPVLTERTVKTNLNFDRLQKIVKEAAEQSERAWLPEIGEIVEFKKVVEDVLGEKIMFEASGEHSPPPATQDRLRALRAGPTPLSRREGSVSVFIGPEGGWSEREINLARENNFQILNLGKNILRAETAAIVGCWMVVNN